MNEPGTPHDGYVLQVGRGLRARALELNCVTSAQAGWVSGGGCHEC